MTNTEGWSCTNQVFGLNDSLCNLGLNKCSTNFRAEIFRVFKMKRELRIITHLGFFRGAGGPTLEVYVRDARGTCIGMRNTVSQFSMTLRTRRGGSPSVRVLTPFSSSSSEGTPLVTKFMPLMQRALDVGVSLFMKFKRVAQVFIDLNVSDCSQRKRQKSQNKCALTDALLFNPSVTLTFRTQNPDTPRAGRVGAAPGGAGQGRVNWDAFGSIRPGNNPLSLFSSESKILSWTSLRKHKQSNLLSPLAEYKTQTYHGRVGAG